MSCFVVIEWNCQTHEDSSYNVVAVFHELEQAQSFINAQPEVMPTPDAYYSRYARDRAEEYKRERFTVEEFDGSKELRWFRAAKNGTLKLDKA